MNVDNLIRLKLSSEVQHVRDVASRYGNNRSRRNFRGTRL